MLQYYYRNWALQGAGAFCAVLEQLFIVEIFIDENLPFFSILKLGCTQRAWQALPGHAETAMAC